VWVIGHPFHIAEIVNRKPVKNVNHVASHKRYFMSLTVPLVVVAQVSFSQDLDSLFALNA